MLYAQPHFCLLLFTEPSGNLKSIKYEEYFNIVPFDWLVLFELLALSDLTKSVIWLIASQRKD